MFSFKFRIVSKSVKTCNPFRYYSPIKIKFDIKISNSYSLLYDII